MQNNREFLYAQIGDNALRGRTNPVRIPYWADSVPVMGLKKRKRRRTYTHIRNTVNLGYEKAHVCMIVCTGSSTTDDLMCTNPTADTQHSRIYSLTHSVTRFVEITQYHWRGVESGSHCTVL